MNPRTHNLLIAARSVLESSGPDVFATSDAYTVARKVLAIQDAVELVMNAICLQLAGKFRVSEGTSFYDLVGHVVSKFSGQDDAQTLATRRSTFDALNHVRVLFKHSGVLPDPPTTIPTIQAALLQSGILCERAFGIGLEQVDALSEINDKDAVDFMRRAEQLRAEGRYKDALEQISRALETIFWNTGLTVRAGDHTSETALLLTGRGVDPASFIAMQQFLPAVATPTAKEAKFDTRLYGHEWNWTNGSVIFCWETALSTMIRLQRPVTIVTAEKFEDVFRDVLTVAREETKVIRVTPNWLGEVSQIQHQETPAELGRRFTGKATRFYNIRPDQDNTLNFDMPLDKANWIRLESHNLLANSYSAWLVMDELWFQAQDVIVTYEESESHKSIRELLEKRATEDATNEPLSEWLTGEKRE